MNFIWEWGFLLGPIALFAVAVLVRLLSARAAEAQACFCAHELALSNLGSLLSATIVTTRALDSSKLLTLIILSVGGVIILLLVAVLHKSFEHVISRPRLRFFMLGVLANIAGGAALATTLYFSSGPVVERQVPGSGAQLDGVKK